MHPGLLLHHDFSSTIPEHTVEVNVSQLLPGSYHYALEVEGRPVAHHNLLVQ